MLFRSGLGTAVAAATATSPGNPNPKLPAETEPAMKKNADDDDKRYVQIPFDQKQIDLLRQSTHTFDPMQTSMPGNVKAPEHPGHDYRQGNKFNIFGGYIVPTSQQQNVYARESVNYSFNSYIKENLKEKVNKEVKKSPRKILKNK